jgi:hypothetical protein
MIGATLTDEKPASKVGLLIQFMFLSIWRKSLQKLNLIAKVRLILPNNWVPDPSLWGRKVAEGVNRIDPASLQGSIPLMFWGEVPRIGAGWIRSTTTCNK